MFRIIESEKGYIVEVKKYKWSVFGLKEKWVPYILTSGMYCAWHHSKIEYAIMNLKSEIIKDIEIIKD